MAQKITTRIIQSTQLQRGELEITIGPFLVCREAIHIGHYVYHTVHFPKNMFQERNDTKQIQIYRTKCFNVCEFCFVPSLDPDFDFCVFFADVIPAPIIMVMVDNV